MWKGTPEARRLHCDCCKQWIPEPAPEQRFCSKRCQGRVEGRAAVRTVEVATEKRLCPHPEKLAWLTRDKAQKAALSKSTQHGAFVVYKCQCGKYHLTHKRARSRIV